jgi:hypothetical protein
MGIKCCSGFAILNFGGRRICNPTKHLDLEGLLPAADYKSASPSSRIANPEKHDPLFLT